jgi:hypothetical protein
LWVYGGVGGLIKTSTDALTWVTRDSKFDANEVRSVKFANGLWVAVGINATLRTSTDAINWATQSTQMVATSSLRGVAFGNGLWVAGGNAGALITSVNLTDTRFLVDTASNLRFFRT